ncbi:hypothetical protein GQ457_01G026090 [Hibiscus cannabinus]
MRGGVSNSVSSLFGPSGTTPPSPSDSSRRDESNCGPIVAVATAVHRGEEKESLMKLKKWESLLTGARRSHHGVPHPRKRKTGANRRWLATGGRRTHFTRHRLHMGVCCRRTLAQVHSCHTGLSPAGAPHSHVLTHTGSCPAGGQRLQLLDDLFFETRQHIFVHLCGWPSQRILQFDSLDCFDSKTWRLSDREISSLEFLLSCWIPWVAAAARGFRLSS